MIDLQDMSLKLIPFEKPIGEKNKKQKYFNPGTHIKKPEATKSPVIKSLCLRLVHFINRGGSFTYQQIDELIDAMQRVILNLQHQKHDIIQKKEKKRK